MPRPRSFDDHLQLFAAFAVAVSQFDALAWNRIRTRCAAFDQASLLAAFERAQIRARPHGYPTSRIAAAWPEGLPLPIRVVASASTVLQTGIAFGLELAQLVPQWREAAWAAVLYHDFLSDRDFASSYHVVAPELSFADLECRAIVV